MNMSWQYPEAVEWVARLCPGVDARRTLHLQDIALEGHEAGAQRLVTAEAPPGDLVATLLSQCLGTSSALPPDTQAE
jgi:hypothetical protein